MDTRSYEADKIVVDGWIISSIPCFYLNSTKKLGWMTSKPQNFTKRVKD